MHKKNFIARTKPGSFHLSFVNLIIPLTPGYTRNSHASFKKNSIIPRSISLIDGILKNFAQITLLPILPNSLIFRGVDLQQVTERNAINFSSSGLDENNGSYVHVASGFLSKHYIPTSRPLRHIVHRCHLLKHARSAFCRRPAGRRTGRNLLRTPCRSSALNAIDLTS